MTSEVFSRGDDLAVVRRRVRGSKLARRRRGGRKTRATATRHKETCRDRAKECRGLAVYHFPFLDQCVFLVCVGVAHGGKNGAGRLSRALYFFKKKEKHQKVGWAAQGAGGRLPGRAMFAPAHTRAPRRSPWRSKPLGVTGCAARPKRPKKEGKTTGKERRRTHAAYRMGQAIKTAALARVHARWVCTAAVVLWLAGTGDAVTATSADSVMASRAVRGALDGACFVAFVAASARLAMQRVGCDWKGPARSIVAAAAAGALVPSSMQATPLSLALFCGCALVGAL